MLELRCDPNAPSAIRHALDDLDQDGWRLGDAVLVASELVTNAVVHSGCSAEHGVSVGASLREDRLLIAVHDPGVSGQPAQVRRGEQFRLGGWGLQIVEELAHRWGSERPDGYRVWAEFVVMTDNAS